MAQRQITALPVADTPDGTELFVVRQDVLDKKLSVDSLKTYIQAAFDDVYLNEGSNLGDLDNVATARTNLDVYSTGEADAAFLLKANNLSGVASPVTAFDNIKQNASVTYKGVVELATTVETDTGTDATRAVTPSGLAYKLGLFQTALESSQQSFNDGRYLRKSNNLSDVNSVSSARTNLSVYSKSESDGSYMKKSSNLSDVSNANTAFNNIKQDASVSFKGVVELATNGETNTGTDATRAVTPAGLAFTLDNFETDFAASQLSLNDGRYLRQSQNLNDLPSKSTARNNLSVYSQSQTDSFYTAKNQNLSDVNNATTAFNNIKQDATTSYKGVVELATNGEAQTGTNATRAVTPAALHAAIGNATAGLALNTVGTYAFLGNSSGGSNVSPGSTTAGSNLRYVSMTRFSNATQFLFSGGSPSGTWRCMGNYDISGRDFAATLWLRIS